MRFVYAPEGVEEQSWPWDPDKLTNGEAEHIEKLLKIEYGDFVELLSRGSVRALHALLFVFLKRTKPQLRYDQVVFTTGEVGLRFDDDEMVNIILQLRTIESEGQLDGDQLDMLNGYVVDRPDLVEIADQQLADLEAEDDADVPAAADTVTGEVVDPKAGDAATSSKRPARKTTVKPTD